MNNSVGLGSNSSDAWPKVTARQLERKPIERLAPNSTLHNHVRDYLLSRIQMAEDAMEQFHGRWNLNERRVQAYIALPDYEQLLKTQNESKGPHKITSLTIPYSYSVINTIATYMLHTYAGRRPMLQVAPYGSAVQEARNMEVFLQYNADNTKLIKWIWQFVLDSMIYGVGVFKTSWANRYETRTVWEEQKSRGFFGSTSSSVERIRKKTLVYQGNETRTLDPYMFLPDPRVPMTEVASRGEFVWWRMFNGWHDLKKRQANGELMWVDQAGALPHEKNGVASTYRNWLSKGHDVSNRSNKTTTAGVRDYVMEDQGTVEIIPKELGLGDSTVPEKWLFTILNRRQIVQAEPFDTDHNQHPVAVAEPSGFGYGFGSASVADYIGILQDAGSWFLNSRIQNVRTTLNNIFVYDPAAIEEQDLKRPGDGKLIRLKPTMMGRDVRSALSQLNVSDHTANHPEDVERLFRMGDVLFGTNDNVKGIESSASRKSATEVRTAGEAAASRLAAIARIMSAQALSDLTMQWSLNTQQFLEKEFEIQLLGMDKMQESVRISPQHIVGDFHYPIHDGTLPLDRIAMLDVHKELFIAVAKDRELRSQYDMGKWLEHLAELGGVKNMASFKTLPDEQVLDEAQKGNLVPLPGSGPRPGGGPSPNIQATIPNPGDRLSGGF